MTRTSDPDWRFGYELTREDSPVLQEEAKVLAHRDVRKIYGETVGSEPATGLTREDVWEHWEVLEPKLRAEIERRMSAAG